MCYRHTTTGPLSTRPITAIAWSSWRSFLATAQLLQYRNYCGLPTADIAACNWTSMTARIRSTSRHGRPSGLQRMTWEFRFLYTSSEAFTACAHQPEIAGADLPSSRCFHFNLTRLWLDWFFRVSSRGTPRFVLSSVKPESAGFRTFSVGLIMNIIATAIGCETIAFASYHRNSQLDKSFLLGKKMLWALS